MFQVPSTNSRRDGAYHQPGLPFLEPDNEDNDGGEDSYQPLVLYDDDNDERPGEAKRALHSLSLLRFGNKLFPTKGIDGGEPTRAKRAYHNLSLMGMGRGKWLLRGGGNNAAGIGGLEEGRDKRVHNLSLLRLGGKLFKPSPSVDQHKRFVWLKRTF